MTPRETAAFNAGIAHAASLAQIAAVTIETRDDASHVRQQAAAAALHGFAEGLRQAAKPASDPAPGSTAADDEQARLHTCRHARKFTGQQAFRLRGDP